MKRADLVPSRLVNSHFAKRAFSKLSTAGAKLAVRTVLVTALLGASLATVSQHQGWLRIFGPAHPTLRSQLGQQTLPETSTGSAGAFTSFDVPGAGTVTLEGTGALAINAAGVITGVYSSTATVFHGFVRAANGTITTFDAPGAGTGPSQGTFPISINTAGDIAGTYQDSSNVSHGFLRAAAGVITEFEAPGASLAPHRGTAAFSINDSDEIAGFYSTGAYDTTSLYHGFIRSVSGTFTSIDAPGAGTGTGDTYNKQGTQVFAINASGGVTGSYIDSSDLRHGFVRQATGTFAEFDPTGVGTSASKHLNGTIPLSMDAVGDVTGTYTDASLLRHGFVRTAAGVITTFDPPGAAASSAMLPGTIAFSMAPAGGNISGTFTDSNGIYHGFVRNSAGAITVFDAPGAATAATSAFAGTGGFAVNSSGNIAGLYFDPNGASHGFLLVPAMPAAASPAFSLASGTYTSPQTVSISDATAGATIYYTLDGSTPTNLSPKYATALTISKTTTIHAIAEATGFANSAIASATYTINPPPASAPVFSPAVGTYHAIQTVTLTDATKGAAIYYTLNGATPGTTSTLYSKPFTLSQTTTVKAIAVAAGFADSVVASGTYTIILPAAAPTFSPAHGTYAEGQSVALTSTTPSATIYYTTNGTTPTVSSPKYTGPIPVDFSETIQAIAAASGYESSPVATAVYILPGSPQVITGLATGVAASGATLNAVVMDFGAPAKAWFVWGAGKTALNNATASTALPASASRQSVSAKLTGIASKTTYYFQAVSASVGGTSYGAIQSFTTP